MEDLPYKDEVCAIQGAIHEVYKILGNAYKEKVYQQCLDRELKLSGRDLEPNVRSTISETQ